MPYAPRGSLRSPRLLLAALLTAVLGLLGAAVPVGPVAPAAAAAETADWFPLTGSWVLWCTMSNPGCGHHPYPALDIGVPGIGSLPIGTPVYAAGPGTVAEVYTGCPGAVANGCNNGSGNFVALKHPDGRTSRYLHLSSVLVTAGTPVTRGQPIGGSGNSGSSTNGHLHYDELDAAGNLVDPGPMKALVNGVVVSYPQALGYSTWFGANGPPYGTPVRNDGFQRKVVEGDFGADAVADRVLYDRATGAWTAPGQMIAASFGGPGQVPVPGDYDGDGETEPAVVELATGTWKVLGATDLVHGGSGDVPVPADYQGDGRTDRAVYDPTTGVWSVAGAPDVTLGGPGQIPVPADYDGDGKADIATYNPANGVWKSVGNAVSVTLGGPGQIPVPADYDGDGDADAATYDPRTGVWRTAGAAAVTYGGPGQVPVPVDVTGDGRADRATYEPGTGTWRVPTLFDVVTGGADDMPAAAGRSWTIWRQITAAGLGTDGNGDARTDVGAWRPSTGTWTFPGQASSTVGQRGDVVVTGDYDGDGRLDRSLYRPSSGVWFIGAAGWLPSMITNPMAGDVPLVADFRGDGRSHPAIFRPATGTLLVEHDAPLTVAGAQPGDVPLAADVDGDGAAELVLFRPESATWIGLPGGTRTFGHKGDLPVLADLDGDGRAEPNVFRPANGKWFSDAPSVATVVFGTAGDVPLVVDAAGVGLATRAVFRPGTGELVVEGSSPIVVGQPGDVPVPRSAATAPLAPAAPTSVQAMPTAGGAVVTFTPPTLTATAASGSSVLSYLVTASPSGATVEVSPANPTAVVGGLPSGPSTFTVAATGPGGLGPASAPSTPVVPTAPDPTAYHATPAPYRALDTRDDIGLGGAFGPGQTRTVRLAGTGGAGGVPASGATSVVLNLTITGGTAATHLTLWAAGQAKPVASNLNAASGQTVANLVVARLGADGKVAIANNAGTAHVIADVVGWFDDGSGSAPAGGSKHVAVTPDRILDTRDDTGLSGSFGPAQARTLAVTGKSGVPASGVTAVVLNLTATEADATTHLTVWPTGQAKPVASSLNVAAGTTVPNLVVATVGAGGSIDLYNNSGHVHVLADIVGYFGTSGGDGFVGLTPARILDTRESLTLNGPFQPGQTRTINLWGKGGIPMGGASAVLLNVTVTNAAAEAFLSLWPAGTPFPGTSSLNYVGGSTVANLVLVRPGVDGSIAILNSAGTADVIFDVAGWYG